ncbi:MAG: hypothetical protein CMM93_00075 [Rickettsiales bacterium]|nr:hypothetical protein [Rickettsiales bacterium]|tara:strand:+ start:135 stop:1478 length:1344 start_codon:yes stop_codon:yes gene_type:complete
MSWASPHRLFLIVSLAIGLIYTFMTPPFRAPDETAHYQRVLAYMEGSVWGPYDTRTRYVEFLATGNQLRPYNSKQEQGYSWEVLQRIWASGADTDPARSHRLSSDGPTVDLYSPAAYLPAIITGWVIDQVYPSPVILFYGMRISLLIASSLLIAWAIARLPYARWPVMALMLFPMAVWGRAMITADSLTTAFALAFIALICAQPWRLKALAVAGMAVTLSKIIFGTLLGLLFLPVNWRKATFGIRVAFCGLFILCAGVGIAWNIAAKDTLQAATERGVLASNPSQQVAQMQTDPTAFLTVLSDTLSSTEFLLNGIVTGITGYLGELDAPLPFLVSAMVLLQLAIILILAQPDETRPTRWTRLWCAAIFFGTLLLTLVALYVQWNPVGNAYIHGFQGRYLYPVLPLLLVALLPPKQWPPRKCVPVICLSTLWPHAVAIATLWQSNYSG